MGLLAVWPCLPDGWAATNEAEAAEAMAHLSVGEAAFLAVMRESAIAAAEAASCVKQGRVKITTEMKRRVILTNSETVKVAQWKQQSNGKQMQRRRQRRRSR